MDKLQEISNYVGNMKIRKTFFGGYDREDVFVKMQELVNMFQALWVQSSHSLIN